MSEIPALTKTSTINEVIFGSRDGMLVSIMPFFRIVDNKKYDALLILTIPIKTCETLFKPLGLAWNSSEDALKDACGEYCNILMGNFQKEIMSMTCIETAIQKTYMNKVTDVYKVPDSHVKFGFGFKYSAKEILMSDLIFFNWEG